VINLYASRDAADRDSGYTAADERQHLERFTVDKRALFKAAWAQAREMARYYPARGTAKQQFAACLRGQWKRFKAAAHVMDRPTGFTPKIADLIVRQRFNPAPLRFANSGINGHA
jgi:hypothetical protein